LYLLIFGHVLEEHVQVFPGVSYTSFLVPGLVMMSVLQNAFANSSSSLGARSKITGNLVFLLMSRCRTGGLVRGYVGASVRARAGGGSRRLRRHGLVCAAALGEPCGSWSSRHSVPHAGFAGADRRAVGREVDQMAAFQNFIIMPDDVSLRRVLFGEVRCRASGRPSAT